MNNKDNQGRHHSLNTVLVLCWVPAMFVTRQLPAKRVQCHHATGVKLEQCAGALRRPELSTLFNDLICMPCTGYQGAQMVLQKQHFFTGCLLRYLLKKGRIAKHDRVVKCLLAFQSIFQNRVPLGVK